MAIHLSIMSYAGRVNRDLHVRLPIYHGSLMPNGNLAYICDTPTMTTSELQRYRYLCISGYMDSGALIQPETHRFPLYDTNGSITALGQMFTGSMTFLQTIVTGINYGANGDENAFLGGWVLQFNTTGNSGKMTCSQYKRCIITTKQIQAYYQYKVTDIWLE